MALLLSFSRSKNQGLLGILVDWSHECSLLVLLPFATKMLLLIAKNVQEGDATMSL